MKQRDCLILGSGRSGTSMAAGILSSAQYFMGDELWPGNPGNPKGQFEDREINAINDQLIGLVLPNKSSLGLRSLIFGRTPRFRDFQRWMAVVPPGTSIPFPPETRDRIQALTARHPFCFKDPRLSYTLAAWRPYLADALLLCVFRHPSVVADSMVRECARADYMKRLGLDARWALKVWEAMYSWILDIHYPLGGNWYFVHYDQLLDGTAYPELESRLGITVDRSFAVSELNRSRPDAPVPHRAELLYQRLCSLAGYRETAA